MSRLPTPGGDSGTWGDVLNGFLAESHNSDGTLKSSAVTSAGAASNANVVHTTGDETIAGVKTFTASPIVPTPTTNSQAANKSYVDGVVGGGTPDADATTKGKLQLAGDLSGTAASPQIATGVIVDADINASAAIAQSKVASLTSDLAAKANDNAVVKLTGDQTVAGVKTFSSAPVVPDSSFTQAKVTNLTTDLASKLAKEQTVEDVTAATYTFVLGDSTKLKRFDSATAQTVTVPPNSSVAFPIGTIIDVAQIGAGAVTLAAGSGVTINSPISLVLGVQYAHGRLVKTGTNQWLYEPSNTGSGLFETIGIAAGDETTSITTGTAKVTFRMPFAMNLTGVRANLNTASTSGLPTVDINEAGISILSTKLTIDANEKTSVTATTPAVISDASLADDAEITIDVDVAGTGAKGLKVWLIGTRA